MNFVVLLNPVVFITLAVSVILSCTITYMSVVPKGDYWISQEDKVHLEKALKPLDGLNHDRKGGINHHHSIR